MEKSILQEPQSGSTSLNASREFGTYLGLPGVERLISQRVAQDDIITDSLETRLSEMLSKDRESDIPELAQSIPQLPMSSLAV